MCCRHCFGNICIRVRGGEKARLVSRRSQVYTVIEHDVEKSVEGIRIACHDLFVVCHRVGIGEETAKHGAGMVSGEGHTALSAALCRPSVSSLVRLKTGS